MHTLGRIASPPADVSLSPPPCDPARCWLPHSVLHEMWAAASNGGAAQLVCAFWWRLEPGPLDAGNTSPRDGAEEGPPRSHDAVQRRAGPWNCGGAPPVWCRVSEIITLKRDRIVVATGGLVGPPSEYGGAPLRGSDPSPMDSAPCTHAVRGVSARGDEKWSSVFT